MKKRKNKKKIEFIILFLIVLFIGFAIGRIFDWFGNSYFEGQSWYDIFVPHHWIPGLILIFIGCFIKNKKYGGYLIAFGIGLMISDGNDLFHLRFFGKEIPHIWRFWSLS